MQLDELNLRLAPLRRKLMRVRARDGVVRYALAPEFDLVWVDYAGAVSDLSQLRAVHAPPATALYVVIDPGSQWPIYCTTVAEVLALVRAIKRGPIRVQ